ncbi:MAG TPA: urease accessory protein UreD [Myxococcales bacterium]|nr:urease accessory protein UreD [Myxococcales bacterium]
MRVFAERRTEGDTPARLSFRRAGPRTVVEAAFATSPLRVLTPRNHGRAAWAYTSTLGGGMVDGDAVRLRLEVGPGAAAVLATQGQNRVYRSIRGCRSELAAEVGEGGFLALLPDPTVCFAGARYQQKTELRLAPAAAAVAVDVLASGRSARGERWAFSEYRGELSLQSVDRLLLRERLLLDPAHGALAERLGRFDAICTVLLAGDSLRAERDELARRICASPLRARADRIEQANELEGALLVRIAAVSLEDALRTVRGHLYFLPHLLGDDPWARRP